MTNRPKKFWARVRTLLSVAISSIALIAAGYGIYSTIHSPLFLVRIVEVADQPEDSPLNAHTVTVLADIPIGKVSLFELDLDDVEKRIRKNPWVRSVRLQKRFPQTVSITVEARRPRGLFQKHNGKMAYLDANGEVFGKLDLTAIADLPVISGLQELPEEQRDQILSSVLNILRLWKPADLLDSGVLSEVFYEKANGISAMVAYPLIRGETRQNIATSRVIIDFGLGDRPQSLEEIDRLKSVLRYLSSKGIVANRIYADSGKKIIVKIVPSS